MRGVIDSPDIPLNVSRSCLQVDSAVKKITNYITRKVADKLNSLFKKDRKMFEEKWNDIKVIIEYGLLSEEKFFEKAEKFSLYPSTDSKYFTYDELIEEIKDVQTDKDGKTVTVETQTAAYKASVDAGVAEVNRNKRTALLAETDYFGLSDVTMFSNMKTYRQALRDFMPNIGSPTTIDDVDWPEPPSFLQ